MEAHKKDIAVVILNWNGRQWLEKFLPTVIEKSSMANIYIADNASTDDSISLIENNFPSVKIIQNQLNEGYAKGYNDALKDLKEKYFVLLGFTSFPFLLKQCRLINLLSLKTFSKKTLP